MIRTLLVEDQPLVLSALEEMFEGCGWDVTTAKSGQEGVQVLLANEFDLVVTDIRMETDTAGFEVIRAAKANVNNPVIVILSAYPIPSSQWQATGADAMFIKGQANRVLMDKMARLV